MDIVGCSLRPADLINLSRPTRDPPRAIFPEFEVGFSLPLKFE
jgi:hypothetical protein